jgi:hypothetical protein
VKCIASDEVACPRYAPIAIPIGPQIEAAGAAFLAGFPEEPAPLPASPSAESRPSFAEVPQRAAEHSASAQLGPLSDEDLARHDAACKMMEEYEERTGRSFVAHGDGTLCGPESILTSFCLRRVSDTGSGCGRSFCHPRGGRAFGGCRRQACGFRARRREKSKPPDMRQRACRRFCRCWRLWGRRESCDCDCGHQGQGREPRHSAHPARLRLAAHMPALWRALTHSVLQSWRGTGGSA